MRYTEKTENGYQVVTEVPNDEEEMNQWAINKLGKLENLEEELGIDLITLFKALNECYTEDGYKGTAMILNDKEIGIKYQLGENSWSSRICKISDYGKTWTLTKEVLL